VLVVNTRFWRILRALASLFPASTVQVQGMPVTKTSFRSFGDNEADRFEVRFLEELNSLPAEAAYFDYTSKFIDCHGPGCSICAVMSSGGLD
jgi:hypothetical protein